MSKLDQKIQEINGKILALDGKKSKLLAIKFGAKGGAGSGRYPAGSHDNSDTTAKLTPKDEATLSNTLNPVSSRSMSPSVLRERVSKVNGVSRALITTDKTESNLQARLDTEKVKIVAEVQSAEATAMKDNKIAIGGAITRVQEMIGMHPADLRNVVFDEKEVSGNPEINYNFQLKNNSTYTSQEKEMTASIVTPEVAVKILITEDNDGNKTLMSNAYVPIPKDEYHTPKQEAMMNGVQENIRRLAGALGISQVKQTRNPKAKF